MSKDKSIYVVVPPRQGKYRRIKEIDAEIHQKELKEKKELLKEIEEMISHCTGMSNLMKYCGKTNCEDCIFRYEWKTPSGQKTLIGCEISDFMHLGELNGFKIGKERLEAEIKNDQKY